jgi:hypothetical protein
MLRSIRSTRARHRFGNPTVTFTGREWRVYRKAEVEARAGPGVP